MTGIKSLLDEVADDALLYDVIEPAVTGGRRRRRARQALVGGGVAVAVLAVIAGASLPALDRGAVPATSTAPTGSTTPPAVPTSCDVQQLPTPDGTSGADVTGADPTGRFVVGRSFVRGSDAVQVIIWDRGVAFPVTVPGVGQAFEDINSSGAAVGASVDPGDDGGAFYYHDGVLTRLAGAAHRVFPWAVAINDQGVIVGSIDIEQGPGQTQVPPRRFPDGRIPGAVNSPVVWRSPSAQPEWLPMPAGSLSGGAVDIDEDGTIVGTVDYDDGVTVLPPTQVVIWRPDGSLVPFAEPVLVQGEPATRTTAVGIRDGWVLGLAAGPGAGTGVTFLWNVHTGEVRTPALPRGIVMSMSANGWFAEQILTSDPGARTPTGFSALVAGDSVLALPSLFDHADDNMGAAAVHTMSDDGTVLAGTEYLDDGSARVAVVWTCR